ncbi:MAG: hypothetical protein MSIBF_01485 [Candidatus Altiarchaeales archaeon IMC4]|nr:MAG: hypothetical protein MSIBF_01485 [Candidatus Altiarchaeales archaeon IMC4]
MHYVEDYADEFLENVKRLKREDISLLARLEKKIDEILKNPEHYKPLRGKHKNKRRAHVGSFVISFRIAGNVVTFCSFKHHDDACQ